MHIYIYIHTEREGGGKRKTKKTEGYEDEKRGVAVGGKGD